MEKMNPKQEETVTIHFDVSDPYIKIPNGSDIADMKVSPKHSYFLPKSQINKSGFSFQGWTPDGINGYEPGDVFIPTKDTTLTPVFIDNSDKNYYMIEYVAEVDGAVVDTSYIPTELKKANSIIKSSLYEVRNLKARQRGWQFEGHSFIQGAKFVMPHKNVVLKPIWHTIYHLTYHAGEYRNVIGKQSDVFEVREGGKKNLPEDTRFTRKGFKIVGWHCVNDNKDYKTFDPFIMPNEDADIYAIWEPINYNVVWDPQVSGCEKIKIRGRAGTTMVAPEINCEKKGYKFVGWKNCQEKGEPVVYVKPGEEFFIEGNITGLGVKLTAVWETV